MHSPQDSIVSIENAAIIYHNAFHPKSFISLDGIDHLITKKEDFNIEIDNDILTISSEVKSEENKEDDGYTRREFAFSSFKRIFSLPETISLDKINASYEDGILKFVMPKKEEALPKPKRLIEIA